VQHAPGFGQQGAAICPLSATLIMTSTNGFQFRPSYLLPKMLKFFKLLDECLKRTIVSLDTIAHTRPLLQKSTWYLLPPSAVLYFKKGRCGVAKVAKLGLIVESKALFR
jgi:hypothetical protein